VRSLELFDSFGGAEPLWRGARLAAPLAPPKSKKPPPPPPPQETPPNPYQAVCVINHWFEHVPARRLSPWWWPLDRDGEPAFIIP